MRLATLQYCILKFCFILSSTSNQALISNFPGWWENGIKERGLEEQGGWVVRHVIAIAMLCHCHSTIATSAQRAYSYFYYIIFLLFLLCFFCLPRLQHWKTRTQKERGQMPDSCSLQLQQQLLFPSLSPFAELNSFQHIADAQLSLAFIFWLQAVHGQRLRLHNERKGQGTGSWQCSTQTRHGLCGVFEFDIPLIPLSWKLTSELQRAHISAN